MLDTTGEDLRVFEDLVAYVERFYDQYNLMDNHRHGGAKWVDMRKIIGKVLRDGGYSWAWIAKRLRKHHTTIIDNYNKITAHALIYRTIKHDIKVISGVLEVIKANQKEFGYHHIKVEVAPRREKLYPQLGFVKYGGSHKIYTDQHLNVDYKLCSWCKDLVETKGFGVSRHELGGLKTKCKHCCLNSCLN